MRNWTHLVPKTRTHPYGRRRAGAKTDARRAGCKGIKRAAFVFIRLLMYKFCSIYLSLPGIFRIGKYFTVISEKLIEQYDNNRDILKEDHG